MGLGWGAGCLRPKDSVLPCAGRDGAVRALGPVSWGQGASPGIRTLPSGRSHGAPLAGPTHSGILLGPQMISGPQDHDGGSSTRSLEMLWSQTGPFPPTPPQDQWAGWRPPILNQAQGPILASGQRSWAGPDSVAFLSCLPSRPQCWAADLLHSLHSCDPIPPHRNSPPQPRSSR